MARGIQSQKRTVVGIDVGGMRKGFHAVALSGGQYAGHSTTADVGELVAWCRKVDAAVIAVDAPCVWSMDGHARPAECRLMEKGIWCFSSPTREAAKTGKPNGSEGRKATITVGCYAVKPSFRR